MLNMRSETDLSKERQGLERDSNTKTVLNLLKWGDVKPRSVYGILCPKEL